MDNFGLKSNGFSIFSVSAKILSSLQDTLTDIVNCLVWGDAQERDFLSLNDVEKWFLQISPKKKKNTAFGFVFRRKLVGYEGVRIYQAVANHKRKIIMERQILAKELDEKLLDEFGCNDFVIYTDNPKDF